MGLVRNANGDLVWVDADGKQAAQQPGTSVAGREGKPAADADGTGAVNGAEGAVDGQAGGTGTAKVGGAGTANVGGTVTDDGTVDADALKKAEHEKKMQDPDYAALYAVNPDEAELAWKTIQTEDLDHALAVNRHAEETDEQREARLKKERRERNLAGALSMVGALGNFVSATAGKDGRAVEVADIPAAVNEKQTKAQQEREKALARLAEVRKRRSEIIENGYKRAYERADADEKRQLQRDTLNETIRHNKENEALAQTKAQNQQENTERRMTLDEKKYSSNESYRRSLLKLRESEQKIKQAAAEAKANSGGKQDTTEDFTIEGQEYKVPSKVWKKVSDSEIYDYLPSKYQRMLKEGGGRVGIIVRDYIRDEDSHKKDPEAWETFKAWMGMMAGSDDEEEEDDRDFSQSEDDEEEDEDLDM